MILYKFHKISHLLKGIVGSDYDEQLKFLQELWFTPYSRGNGIMGSSSFEHVFMAELRDRKVLGMHNWLYFAEQEQQGHVDYKGWLNRVETGRVRSINCFNCKILNIASFTMFIIYSTISLRWPFA